MIFLGGSLQYKFLELSTEEVVNDTDGDREHKRENDRISSGV